MDPLALIRTRAALHAALQGAFLRELRPEPPHRLRFVLETTTARRSLLVSLHPELPWIGRPAEHGPSQRAAPGAFVRQCISALVGRRLDAVSGAGPGRVAVLRWSGGGALAIELAPHGANLVLLTEDGEVAATARPPRAALERLQVGAAYGPPPVPLGGLDPQGAPAAELDRVIDTGVAAGESVVDAIRRRIFGIGSWGARLASVEAARSGRTTGTVLAERLRGLALGAFDPVVASDVADPVAEAEAGRLDVERLHLLPWPPGDGDAAFGHLITGADAAATVGIYYEAAERAAAARSRAESLRAVLRREIKRLAAAEDRAAADAAGFDQPERFRAWGEAILAGLSQARRTGEHVEVPDPYDPEGRTIRVPAPAAMPLTAAAEQHFKRYRRAKRGAEAASARIAAVRGRRERLACLEADPSRLDADGTLRLAAAMRREGIPVGLEPTARRARVAAVAGTARPEGVRLFSSVDGWEVLIGKSGRDNDRLTFRLAAPDDFWLHVLAGPGAHVVIRNPGRALRPPQTTLAQAAAAAAWFSDARGTAHVDVRWTRRKYVRRARGAAPGTVVVKRSETVRVPPGVPEALAGER